jgi:HK97 gp10 family phage protein
MPFGKFKFDDAGLKEFLDEIKSLDAAITDTSVLDIIEPGVEQFVQDARRLPKPRRALSKGGYTHMLDSVTYERNRTRNEIEVGWGKYYGPFVERGTRKMRAQPHLSTLWSYNESVYIDAMRRKFEELTK